MNLGTVNVTDKAVSALTIQLMKFEVAPPGQMETIKIPILSSSERLQRMIQVELLWVKQKLKDKS